MEPLNSHTGILVPLRRAAVDTDQIIPASYMKRVTKTGYQDALFAGWRQDPDFILNHAPYERGTILIAGPAFGSGSSREHAVWALRDAGFRAILAPSFADIFRGNAGKQGLLAAVMAEEDIERLMSLSEKRPGTQATVDLSRQVVVTDHANMHFEVDSDMRWRMLNGLDDIDLTLRHVDDITAFERRRPRWLPRTLPARTAGG